MGLRKGNLKRETEFLQIAMQNNAIRTIYIRVRIDKTQQKSRRKLCGDRDEMIDHIKSKCSKLAQKEYKTRYDWVDKAIHWELCKKLKKKWYMHKPEYFLKYETNKLQGDLEIQTTRSFSNQQKKRTCRIVDLAVPADHSKIERKPKKNKYLDDARVLKNSATWRWRWYQLL